MLQNLLATLALRRSLLMAGAILAIAVATLLPLRAANRSLPSKLSDEEFWQLVSEFSERAGTFQSDNLLSNERWLQHVIPDLVTRARPNRVYVGVGSEQ